jgi:hypothetical protein
VEAVTFNSKWHGIFRIIWRHALVDGDYALLANYHPPTARPDHFDTFDHVAVADVFTFPSDSGCPQFPQ